MRCHRIDFRSSSASRLMRSLAVAGGAALVVAACGGSPTTPTAASSPVQLAVGADGSLLPSGLVAANLSPEQLTARGWFCRIPPVPDRQVCSPPNQPILSPALPVDERPASVQLLVFNGAGIFQGTEVLIREDLYRGQTCESTKTTYDYRPLIGYYECVHTVGR